MSPARNRKLAFMSGGGEAGEAMRGVDWANTPLGPVESWSYALRTTVGTLLRSRHPMFLWWGPELVQLYNDAYRPSFGAGKHPAAMGQRGADCWQEIWPIIWPQIEGVMSCGAATYHEDQLVPIFRNGRLEEVFWTYGYSPVLDDDGTIGGCLVVCTETTGRALAERRLTSLQHLAQRTVAEADMRAIIEATLLVLEELATYDVMFAMVYAGWKAGTLKSTFGLEQERAAQLDAFLRPNLPSLAETREPVELSPALQFAGRIWPEPVERIVVERFGESDSYLVFGLSPRLSYDKAYRDYLAQVARHITVSEAKVTAFRARLLVESERNSLLMQAPLATALLTGPKLVYQLANPKYVEIVGGRDILGKEYLVAFPEVAGNPVADILFDAYQKGERITANEMCVPLDRDGDGVLEDCYFTFAVEPLREPSGKTYGLMVVAMDITLQVQARKELEATQVELLEASRAKDEFLAMLGHELRNPLSPILTALELMRLRGIRDGAEERAIIERQLGHVVSLVDDLLDVARITRGELTLDRKRVSLGGVVRRAIEQASPLIERGGHRLEVDADDEVFVDGDPTRLAQVVANLLTNAAKYTHPGGFISVRAKREGDRAVVHVIDDGIGLAEEEPERLFEAFHREGRFRRQGSLGLGLTIVRSLVIAHGGQVSLRSAGMGRGTEAVVSLPLASAAAAVSGQEQQPAPYAVPPLRLLIVDDNEDAAHLLGAALRRLGHEVQVANDGAAALRLAREYVPDVALLDLGMPVMDGYELAVQLRREPAWREVRLVAVTGYGQPSDRNRTQAAGFHAHLVKPVDVSGVDRQIRELALRKS